MNKLSTADYLERVALDADALMGETRDDPRGVTDAAVKTWASLRLLRTIFFARRRC
jgi:hypothetical protein